MPHCIIVKNPDHPLNPDLYKEGAFNKEVIISSGSAKEAGLTWYEKYAKDGVQLCMDEEEMVTVKDIHTGTEFVVGIFPVTALESYVSETYNRDGDKKKTFRATFRPLTASHVHAYNEDEARAKALKILYDSIQKEIIEGKAGFIEIEIEEL